MFNQYLNKHYCYKAKVISCYDGDTVRLDIDLGLSIVFKNQSFRLFGIDTPEVRGETKEEGLKSRDYLRSLITDKELTVYTVKDKKGKYGRFLGLLYLDELCLNEDLVNKGYAIFKEY